MSILGSIFSKIIGHRAAAAPAGGAGTGTASPGAAGAPVAPSAPPPPVAGMADAGSPGTRSAPAGSAGNTATLTGVDVAAILSSLAASNGENLDWRHSIVDMMKLLGLDSSLPARRALAQELHYSGDAQDSAAMNIWLHKQVMTKLAENGGKVPDDLRA